MLTIQLLVVCLTLEFLFTKIFDFFNMWVLASFQATEFVDQPVLKMLDIFVCQTSENKAFFTKHSILKLLFAKNENTI